MQPLIFDGADLMKQVTLEVRIDTKQLDRRLWLAKQLIRLAARILGCGIDIKLNEEKND